MAESNQNGKLMTPEETEGTMGENGLTKPAQKLTTEYKLSEAQSLKQKGNDLYKAKSFKEAIRSYHQALLYLRGITQVTSSSLGAYMGLVEETKPQIISPDTSAEVTALKTDCFNNLAACILQQEKPNYEKVIKYCDEVLELAPNNAKAMYRKGVAHYQRHDYDKSQSCLLHAKELKGTQKDPAIEKFLSLCEVGIANEDKKLKARFKGMFDK